MLLASFQMLAFMLLLLLAPIRAMASAITVCSVVADVSAVAMLLPRVPCSHKYDRSLPLATFLGVVPCDVPAFI
jgi:hypothetical protein